MTTESIIFRIAGPKGRAEIVMHPRDDTDRRVYSVRLDGDATDSRRWYSLYEAQKAARSMAGLD